MKLKQWVKLIPLSVVASSLLLEDAISVYISVA